MRGLAALLLGFVALALVFTRAEPLGPSAAVEAAPAVVGAGTPLTAVAHDRGTGLSLLEVRLVPPTGDALVLGRQEFPRTGWLGSGVHDATLTVRLGDSTAVPEGPATLEVWASDHSWMSALRGGPRSTQAVTIDRTPPALAVLSSQHHARQGGSESAVFRVGDDAVESGVQVGDLSFPAAAGVFADPALRVALFAIPWDRPDATPQVYAADAAGNVKRVAIDIDVKPRTWAQKTLPISDDFLQQKVPELLAANGLDTSGTLVEGYLRVNRELRARTETRVRDACRGTTPSVLWDGAFMRLPDGAPLSSFADQRSYVHDGAIIDKQTHLGFDLASLKRAAVPAGNTGRVVFTGPLGIYGETVVIDHGLGLFSLYGHLSEIAVAPGATVRKGDLIGKTGETGLAGGDHLHFSTMVHGIHVDPVEWWDAHWIRDHVLGRMAAYPRATTPPAGTAPAAAPPAGGSPAAPAAAPSAGAVPAAPAAAPRTGAPPAAGTPAATATAGRTAPPRAAGRDG